MEENKGFQVLYRFFNSNNELLYVGISNNFFGRVGGHKADKEWFKEIAYSTFEHYESRAEVDKAETRAILNEKPLYNKAKQPDFHPVDYHIKVLASGAIYHHRSNRFRNNHEWSRLYISKLSGQYVKILKECPIEARNWLVFNAYQAAKRDGFWCRSCDAVLESEKVQQRVKKANRLLASAK